MPASGRRWYRGDCHVHSVHSDGELTPQRLLAEARAARLDFIAVTEHNAAAGLDAWRTADGGPLVIPGEEVTTSSGHWLALGLAAGQVIDWRGTAHDGTIGARLAEVHGVGGLCVAAHPHAPYPTGAFRYPLAGFDAVEVWNGPWASGRPWQADNEAALATWERALATDVPRGHWRPAMGDSDAHLAGQIGTPHTVVLADAPTPGALLAGLGAGRSWIAASAAVGLAVTVSAAGRTAGIGDRLTTGGAPATARVTVRGVPDGTIDFRTERGSTHRTHIPGTAPATAEWHTTAAESTFIRVEVRDSEGHMAALSNPVVLR
ncbi:CehA/McbA family metallohydrolase [Streptomyces sp. RFCAC02]|uniref:CehA/McbA family metallohydrolase n=1 Tax=Streptomyces sp. RFCAC02 TaxID=2499143 RepID=UPI0010201FE8|nr:CehA/McbA family metallohydrolase [Streptomyces sp. RFCAC02]